MKKAFITGVTGQDGSYLAEFLLEKGYDVHAILRRSSVFTTPRIDHLMDHERFHTYHGDLTDSSNLHTLMAKIKPDEVYNLAAQSHVGVSFKQKQSFTKHLPQSCLVVYLIQLHKVKLHLFTLNHLMVLRKYIVTGSL